MDGGGSRKLLQGREGATEANPEGSPPPPSKARNPRDLRIKITSYVMRMTRRSARVADQILDEVKLALGKSTATAAALKVKIKNANNLVKVERLKQGTEEKILAGRCTGNTCFRGVMFKGLAEVEGASEEDGEEGEEVNWVCRRGDGTPKETRLAFSCSMTNSAGELNMCVGKERWFGEFWVPFLKELTCPADMANSCTESRICGSDDLPLTKPVVQKQLRNECAQL